jgi:hypothetical protein
MTERAEQPRRLGGDIEETDVQDGTKDQAADFDAQGASARPGGEAAGGSAAKAGDPASPGQADAADREARNAMRKAGFGDDKGGDIS